MEAKKKETTKKDLIKKLPWLLVIPLGFFLPRIAANSPWEVERMYSRGAYPVISRIISGFTGLFGFSAAELFVCSVIMGVLIFLIRSIIMLIGKRYSPLRFVYSFICCSMY